MFRTAFSLLVFFQIATFLPPVFALESHPDFESDVELSLNESYLREAAAESFVCECPSLIWPDKTEGTIALPERVRVALVLGSGGARGIAHVGVIEELVNAHIPIDLIVGCSAGSAIGALYASCPDLENLKLTTWKIGSNTLFNFDFWNCRYGIYQGENLKQTLQDHLSAKTFDELHIPLVVAAADLLTGELVSLGEGEIAPAIQASCSFPFLFTPCEINGRVLVDGGVINPVPAAIARDLGAEVIIAVDLSEPLSQGIPNHCVDVFLRSADILFLWQNEICANQADIVIRPKTVGVGTFGDHLKVSLYEAGKKATREAIDAIKVLLENRDIIGCEPIAEKRIAQLPVYNPTVHK